MPKTFLAIGRVAALAAMGLVAACAELERSHARSGPPVLSLEARLRLAEATDARNGGTAAMRAVLTEAAAASPRDVSLLDRLAALSEAADAWTEAADAAARAVALAPTRERLVRLGRLELRLGRATAAETWRRAVAAGPPDPDTLNGLGLALDMTGQPEAAHAAYREALSLSPRHWSARANLGMSLLLSGNAQAALEALVPAETDPDASVRARHNLAIALAALGEHERMNRLLRAEPGRTRAEAETLARDIRDFARWLANDSTPAPRERRDGTTGRGTGRETQPPR